MKSKILTMLLSVFIALGLWLYVITVVSPGSEKTYYNIPVNVQNDSLLTERGLMITENQNPTVTLHLVGDRVDLNKLSSSNITITVDASRIYEAGRHSLSFNIAYPGDIADDAISVQSRSTSTISLLVEDRISKAVDVVVEYTGQLSEDFICDKENAILTNEVINVTGPRSSVEKIAQARIRVDLEGKTETISQDFVYTLCDEAGEPVDADLVETDAANVGLTVKIQRVKEIPVKLNIISGGGATEQTASITVDPMTIRVSGSESQLEKLTEVVLGTIDLAQQLEAEVLTFPIVLPEGITNETGITEATVDIQFPNLATKKVTVTNITAINIPAGLEVDLITQQLEITIRGPVAMIEAIEDSDVSVKVDFTNAQIGTATVKATVVISGAYPDVGAINSYSVSATLREPVPAEGA